MENSSNSQTLSQDNLITQHQGEYLIFPFENKDNWEAISIKLMQLDGIIQADSKNNETIQDEKFLQSFFSVINHIGPMNPRNKDLVLENKNLHSFIIKLCLDAPFEFEKIKIPLFYIGQNKEFSLTKKHAAIIVALMYFGLFDLNECKNNPNFPRMRNFTAIITIGQAEFLKCLYNYFCRIQFLSYDQNCFETLKKSQISYNRVFIKDPLAILQKKFTKKLSEINPLNFSIEEMNECINIDFANKFIGGGALFGGNVQEEIRFFLCPELFPSILIFERQNDNEAIFFIGTEQYSSYRGYGSNFQFSGDYIDNSKFDSEGRKMLILSAIDAINFRRNQDSQFSEKYVNREIFKAFIGFSILQNDSDYRSMAIASGNWGCGVFAGNKDLKFLIQWLSASAAGRKLNYSCFKNNAFCDYLKNYVDVINAISPNLEKFYQSIIDVVKNITNKKNFRKVDEDSISLLEDFIQILKI